MMRLRSAGASPFARKVAVFASEAGLSERLELVATDYDDPKSGLWEENPLGRVPTLVLEDGGTLAGSSVICAYLDSLYGGARLIPENPEARWRALHGEALSDGMCEAAIAIQRELARPDALRMAGWIERQRAKVSRTVKWLDREWEFPDETARIDLIALACTLGWMEYRLKPELGDWRQAGPKLSTWFDRFSERPSMRDTRPG